MPGMVATVGVTNDDREDVVRAASPDCDVFAFVLDHAQVATLSAGPPLTATSCATTATSTAPALTGDVRLAGEFIGSGIGTTSIRPGWPGSFACEE